MYSEDDIDSAVQAGVLSKETAVAFREFVEKQNATSAVDEEHLRLITGFNDVFVVIAGILMLTACYQIGKVFIAEWVGDLMIVVASWMLSEYFVRQRRMALPAIVFLLAFVGGLFFTGVFGVQALLHIGPELNTSFKASPVFGTLLATVGAWLHWRRFKVPITFAAGFAAFVGLIISLILTAIPGSLEYITLFMFAGGLGAFWLGLQWDAEDPSRMTKKSDIAFWLHLLAAPMMVHPIFSLLDVFNGEASLWKAVIVVVIYLVIGLVSLAVDRRALMVSALIYVLATLASLLKHIGSVSLGFAFAAFLIGGGLLLLSAFWHPCRAYVLGTLPKSLQRLVVPYR